RVTFLTSEYSEIQSYIEKAVSADHIEAILLIDRNNVVVVSSLVDRVGNLVGDLSALDDSPLWKEIPISNATGNMGRLAINFSRSGLIGANHAALNAGGKVAMLGMIMIAFIGLAVGILLTRRLEKIKIAVQHYDEGEFSFRANLHGNDEISVMSRSFDHMADKIEQDFAQLQEREEALKLSQSSLEKKVEVRTQELQIARDHAMQCSHAKSAFLANMSHELRTPLHAIIGYGELLGETINESNYNELVPDISKIQSAGRHLLALINEILDLSKIEAGKRDVNILEFGLFEVVTQIVDNVRPILLKNDNQFSCDFSDDAAIMVSDPTIVHQALLNLLGNAAKFTQGGKVHLTVGSYQQDDRAWVKFSVADNGIGISKNKLVDLFLDFTQADSSLTRKYGGTGLGLAISRRVCLLLGGDISVASQLNEGSEFTMTLPQYCEQGEVLSPLADEPSVESQSSASMAQDTMLQEPMLQKPKLQESMQQDPARNTG
ncbi:MAG: ATP-binding protein, partial [Thiohalomonadales bacterium]